MKAVKPRTLHAVYDLSFLHPGLDALAFLDMAEQRRLALGLEDIHFIVLPAADSAPDRSVAFMLESVGMLQTVKHSSNFNRREDAEEYLEGRENVFAAGKGSQLKQVVRSRNKGGEPTRRFQPSPIAAQQAAQWIQRTSAGKKLVLLAPGPWDEEQKIQQEEWAAFIRSLDMETYQPVLVRDISDLYTSMPGDFPSCLECNEAAISPDFRHSLSERAFITIAEEGPFSHLLVLDPGIPCILFVSDRHGPLQELADAEGPPDWGPRKHIRWAIPGNNGFEERFRDITAEA